MYECKSGKRFLRLLLLDAVIFMLCYGAFFIGRGLLRSSAGSTDDAVVLPAIMYHSVFSGKTAEYVASPQQLESDLRWLDENGFESVTAQQLIEYTQGKGSLPDKPVLITFDDGFYNNLSEALPVLKKYDVHAIVSVVGTYTEINAPVSPHAPAYSYLTWEDISELEDSGLVEIGNHTYDMHSLYSGRKGCSRTESESEEEYASALRTDIGALQSELIRNCDTAPAVFAYPFGAVSREATPVLRSMGFQMTLTCREAPNYITRDPICLFGIGRYNRSGLYSTEGFMEMITRDIENGS